MERRLAAILLIDIVGYTRLIGLDENGTIALQKAHREEVIAPRIALHAGRIVKSTGDGLLVEFASVVDAVQCAVHVQRDLAKRDIEAPVDRRIVYRIGINLGDIVIEDGDILGDGVNIAARLEGLAKPGGICISDTVHQHISGKIDVVFSDAGHYDLKNVSHPVRAWQWTANGANTVANAEQDQQILPHLTKPSIAVLPFNDPSGDEDHFATGISEDLSTALSKYRSFFVTARNSTLTYGVKSEDMEIIGRQLGVRYVVTGSVRRGGPRIRVTAKLIEASSGNNMWADRFDGELTDIFDLQDQITRTIVTAIMPELGDAEHARALRRAPENLDAWELYHRGMWHAHRLTKIDLLEADNLLRKSIDLDPNFAAAQSGLAFVVQHRTAFGWSKHKEQRWSETLQLAQNALAIDPRD
ncbi:MAG: adenylate/guanylate cyclase domain-containing protein, partial [Hyphomicrobiaceae bacterium]